MELNSQLTALVEAYQPDPDRLATIKDAPVLLTVGITGAGKNAILDRLLKKYPERYRFIISHTTRAMRDYERQDINYHFIDFATAEQMIQRRDFIEAAIVHSDNIYATSIAEIAQAQHEGKIACTDLDIQGVDHYFSLGLNAKAVFLLPPSFDVWQERLKGRYPTQEMAQRDYANRLESAIIEIERALAVDYYYIVINDDLEKTVDLVNQIANGDPVEPHYHKAMMIAEEMLNKLRAELQELV